MHWKDGVCVGVTLSSGSLSTNIPMRFLVPHKILWVSLTTKTVLDVQTTVVGMTPGVERAHIRLTR